MGEGENLTAVRTIEARGETPGPRIYNLFPLLAGSVADWKKHLPRIARMGFDWVYLNPFHYPGFSGSLYAVKDYHRLNPIFRGASRKPDDALLQDFLTAARKHGIDVMMDLVINHTAKDSDLVTEHPDWYLREADGSVRSPSAIDPADATNVTVWGDLAEIDFSERPELAAIVDYWSDIVRYYARLGFRGFRCDAAYKVPAAVWSALIGAARAVRPDAVFAAETLGCRLDEVAALRPAGFDFLFNSSKWWDFRGEWLLQQYDDFRRIAPSISFPESHDTDRLAAEAMAQGLTAPDRIEALYRQRYLFAATFSTGLMMPIGYEFGFRRKLDVVRTRPADWEEPLFDLSDYIAEVNAMKAEQPVLNEEGPQVAVHADLGPAVALVRRGERATPGWVATILNPDGQGSHGFAAGRLADVVTGPVEGREITPERPSGEDLTADRIIELEPFAARVFRGEGDSRPRVPASGCAVSARTARLASTVALPLSEIRSTPVIIQNVWPEIDHGRYPVKREVGDVLEVWADIFREGHEKIAAVLKCRRKDEADWHEVPMTLENPGLDRWCGRVTLTENTRYLYTIEAWRDAFESWRDGAQKKRDAGQAIGLELLEGRLLVERTLAIAQGEDRGRLERLLEAFDRAETEDERADLLLSPAVQGLMARWPDRSQATQYEPVLEVVVDRVAARFAAWYEMFPRSQGTEPGRSATFRDCERRLPEIRDMGFDVVYLVPIHPIGRTFRKGPNNTLASGPDDPGSPYAIGSEEGGHTAVHPDLGTLEDFRRFVAAAERHGMEVALDFAIQCSPDHPWIKEHPEWFEFRPDGSIKYAENPPKKYQDIVNVNFYGEHREELWRELLKVVLFWVDQGVKTFRVDNPHTKPVPFWEWLIRSVQERHPEVIFLSEAFTRPPMLKMLAKVGFSQSYTYFTWRNFKEELIEYLTELTQTEVKEYLRPNFFTNTPDILPTYLQTGGRPAFKIRLVLAATLSSVYGIYNGFELCENTAIPNTEEYLNSEKYEYKVWDWDRPGNIKDYIARVNRIRRENPALHELDNLRFYPSDGEQVLFYGKMTPDRGNMIFVAVNLDPFEPQESEVELPLEAMGIPEDENFEVEDLLTGAKHLWRGARHRLRLDPEVNPAAILRIAPWTYVDYRTPCF